MAIRETERKAPSTYLWSIPNVYIAQPAAYLRVPILGGILFVVTCRHQGWRYVMWLRQGIGTDAIMGRSN